MIERCGERQRKFDGLGKWQFRIFIEGLPIMLQLALFLLACGLSRYMWSLNTSVARVVISFTLVAFLFYIGIVIAGTCSYECPFQTPVSIALRRLKDSEVTHKLLSSPFPLAVISLIPIVWRGTRILLMALSSLIYATWVGFNQGLVSAFSRTCGIIRRSSTWKFFQSRILSSIHDAARNVGHRGIVLFLKMDERIRDAKLWTAQGARRLMRAGLLPTFAGDVDRVPVALPRGQGLRVHVRNVETIRRQNMDNGDCVSWVLRSITDPEALDAAIRLAGTIRWFDGDSDHDPPFDVIVSAFEACFDSTKQPYPGMTDRAYFAARAVLQINMRARIQSHEHASKYPIPTISSTPLQSADVDLHHIVYMLERNAGTSGPALSFPYSTHGTRAHGLWCSNLLVDLVRAGLFPINNFWTIRAAARTDHRPAIANVLVMWYLLLGGHTEEETLWAVDKSYAVVSLLSPPKLLTLHM